MILEKLIVKNEDGKQIIFSVNSDYHVNIKKDVRGLSDATNEIYTQRGLGQYGATVTGYQLKSRIIEIQGSFKPIDKNTVSFLRQNLNNVLSPEETLEVTYDLSGNQRKISGITQEIKFDSGNIYYDFYISILCPDPLWRDPMETATSIVSWEGAFEFPVEITSDWEIGRLNKQAEVNVINRGDVTCGCRIVFYATASLTNPSLKNTETEEYIKLKVSLSKGDKLEVTTHYRNKTAYITRADGEKENAIQYLDPSSTFLQLEIGDNLFGYNADSGKSNLEITIYHDNLYRGV
ncbi:MAG: phage tail family protein [Candidatus Limousia pullorum]